MRIEIPIKKDLSKVENRMYLIDIEDKNDKKYTFRFSLDDDYKIINTTDNIFALLFNNDDVVKKYNKKYKDCEFIYIPSNENKIIKLTNTEKNIEMI